MELEQKTGFKGLLDIKEFQLFKKTLIDLNKLITEIKFKISKNGIKARILDPSSIALIEIEFKAYKFNSYFLNDDLEIALNLKDLKNLLSSIDNKARIEIKVNSDKLIITEFIGSSLNTYELSLLDLENIKFVDIPKIDKQYLNTYKLDNKVFYKTIKDLVKVNTSLEIAFNNKDLVFIAKNDYNSIKKQIDHILVNMNYDTLKAKYSLDYLKAMVNNYFKSINISYGNDYPITLFYNNDFVSLTYILAPRVEN